MTLPFKLAAGCMLGALLGAAPYAAAQDSGVTKRRVPADPDAAELNRLLASAQSSMDQKDYVAAAEDYQEYLAKKPDDATVHFDLGYAYTAMQQPDDAKSEYEKAIELDDKLAPAYLNLGLTLLPSDPAAAVDPLQHAADLMADQARPKVLLGTALERSGKLDPAIDQYRAAEKIDATDFETHFSLGRALLTTQRPADAEAEFRAALALNADSAEAHLGLADSLIAQKKSDATAQELNTYLLANPNDANARIALATALAAIGKYDAAIAQLDRATAAQPQNLRALELTADIYWQQKKYDAALPFLLKAQPLAPNDPLIPARLGHIDLAKKNYPDALHQLATAYKLDPSNNAVLADLVEAEYDIKNYDVALQALDALSKRGDLPPASWFVRAACYDKLNRPADALDAYQKFLYSNKDTNSDMYFEASDRVRFLKKELQNKKR
jgi:tetratricopeptide (TPR) repeat protein